MIVVESLHRKRSPLSLTREALLVKTALRHKILGSPFNVIKGSCHEVTEGIKDSEVFHKVQSEGAQSAVKHCNELQSEACVRQDEVWEIVIESLRLFEQSVLSTN